MEDVLADSLADDGVEVEFLQANRTSLYVLFVLYRNQLSWHELLEMCNIRNYRGLPVSLPRVLLAFLTIDQYN